MKLNLQKRNDMKDLEQQYGLFKDVNKVKNISGRRLLTTTSKESSLTVITPI